jgi:glycosyltransferase involved in cell wall biosynthesis
MKPKITIAIPAYNAERTIAETLKSALAQDYPLKEIVVLDDGSTDQTKQVVRMFPEVKLLSNPKNKGIGMALQRLMEEAQGKYVFYLCADDLITHPSVIRDVVSIFDNRTNIGVIGRYFYFFMDGYPGAIGVCRDKNILTQSCCPSGIALRKMDDIIGTNKIFVEMPTMAAQYLGRFRWTMMEYDTVAARFHPGGNTGTKTSYYTESPTQNWIDLCGKDFEDFPMFIQLKNRAPKLLWREICLVVRNNRMVMLKFWFWLYSLTALFVPRFILKKFSNFYRHRIARKYSHIIERGKNV